MKQVPVSIVAMLQKTEAATLEEILQVREYMNASGENFYLMGGLPNGVLGNWLRINKVGIYNAHPQMKHRLADVPTPLEVKQSEHWSIQRDPLKITDENGLEIQAREYRALGKAIMLKYPAPLPEDTIIEVKDFLGMMVQATRGSK